MREGEALENRKTRAVTEDRNMAKALKTCGQRWKISDVEGEMQGLSHISQDSVMGYSSLASNSLAPSEQCDPKALIPPPALLLRAYSLTCRVRFCQPAV
jgi:hypothetical protein